MSDPTTGYLLINLGTPDEPTPAALRRYLREFLSDPDVIDIPAAARFLLVNAIIVPFRAPKSAHAYRSIWTEEGSPLRHLTQKLHAQVDRSLSGVEWAMRYGNPGCLPALQRLRSRGVTRLRILPLYPQYAQSTVASTITHVRELLDKIGWNPELEVVGPFYRDAGYLEAQAQKIKPLLGAGKHLLLSFHGIPERHVLRSSPSCGSCLPKPACEKLEHSHCYRGQCYETAHGIARTLGLGPADYSVSFQSRLGRTPWIQPFTDGYLDTLLQKGHRRLVVACPSFVTDCLETLEEIGIRERGRFLSAGGESLELAPCLNDSTAWSQVVTRLLQEPAHA